MSQIVRQYLSHERRKEIMDGNAAEAMEEFKLQMESEFILGRQMTRLELFRAKTPAKIMIKFNRICKKCKEKP